VKTENVDVAKMHYQIGWCRALERSLRRQDIWPVLEDLLSEDEIKKLRRTFKCSSCDQSITEWMLEKLWMKTC
jgi:putative membrane protein